MLLHKTSKQFVDWCLENEVNHVVMGNPEGVQRNTKKKRRKDVNQKLSNWSFGKLYSLLQYKLKANSKVRCSQLENEYFVGWG